MSAPLTINNNTHPTFTKGERVVTFDGRTGTVEFQGAPGAYVAVRIDVGQRDWANVRLHNPATIRGI